MNEYVIAKYIRLSIDDEITESLSIPNQQLILNKHIEELCIPNATILEFIDNGVTGTIMERPAVQEMLDLVQRGGINCIVIKDFSRFSRNATESNYLIDKIFPLYQVRFISVGDYYDSVDYKDDTGGINVAFKQIINEYYSMDLSKKVKSAKRIQMTRGGNIVANAIYGYQKNCSGKWEPDPAPAEVVRQIFQMALEGLSTAQIRDKLCEAGYPTPLEYIKIKRGKDIIPECIWTARMVLHMLNNEQYTGTYISGKQESKAVGSHSKINIDRSNWIIIPDSHPPIVSKEDFSKIQNLIKYRKGSTTAKPIQSDMSLPRRVRMINGESIASTPIYGYMKMPEGNWEIDEPAAHVIKEIYKMASQGLSFAEISGKLFEAGYPTPSEYINLSKGNPIKPTNRWTIKSVREILKNEQYTGAYISGKILKDYESGRSYHTPKNEWIVIPDKHPAIISKEIFCEVQEITAKKRIKRKNMQPRDYLLHGKVACGCCRYALMYDDSCEYKSYRCNHTHADTKAECRKMKVSAPELDEAVLAMINRQAEVVLNNDMSNLSLLNIGEIKRKFSEYEAQIHQAREQRQKYYSQFIRGQIDRETFLLLKSECTSTIEKLDNQLAVLKKAELDKHANRKTVAIAKETLSETLDKSPQAIVETLIEKVYVFPGNRIEINWKITDFTAVVNTRW